jgi:hypothetical protein
VLLITRSFVLHDNLLVFFMEPTIRDEHAEQLSIFSSLLYTYSRYYIQVLTTLL